MLTTITSHLAKLNSWRLTLACLGLPLGLLIIQPAAAGVFTPTGSLREAREDHTATVLLDGRVLVAGGYGTNSVPSAELYDPPTGVWTNTGALIPPRRDHTATLLPDGKVLVAGGWVTNTPFAGAALYNPAIGTWTNTGLLNTARYGHTATLLPNGKVLVAGGESHNGTNYVTVGVTELYDPATGMWTASGMLNVAREWHTATLLPNGKVLVAGGFHYSELYFAKLNSAELYNPVTGTWTFTGQLSEPRFSHTATLLPNGKVLVAGGGEWGSFGLVIPFASAELYDPANGNWTATGQCIAARWEPTATLLGNGHVLLAGGGNHVYLPFSSAEHYDPISGQWFSVGNMTTNRIWHTATLLVNGKVLLAAGQDWPGGGNLLSSAELYDPGTGGVPLSPLPRLISPKILPNGSFQFSFTNTPGARFTILATTFPTLPASEWMALGIATETAPGQFQFSDTHATNHAKCFYRVRQP